MNEKAYAKINIALKVLGTLPNGYHDLMMYNSRVDLFDEVIINKSSEDLFQMNPSLCLKEDNLAYKAYQIMKSEFDIKNCYSIKIIKNIPSGAGLGGGSADAACVINSLVKLENIKVDKEKLIKIASKLGADVPYCLYGEKAIVSGIGDKIQILKTNKEYLVILASPSLFISTKKIFEQYKGNDSEANFDMIIANLDNPTPYIFNDLEKTAKMLYPEYKLEETKTIMLKNGALNAIMTGSGSSIVGLFELGQEEKIKCCVKEIQKAYSNVDVKICKTISY